MVVKWCYIIVIKTYMFRWFRKLVFLQPLWLTASLPIFERTSMGSRCYGWERSPEESRRVGPSVCPQLRPIDRVLPVILDNWLLNTQSLMNNGKTKCYLKRYPVDTEYPPHSRLNLGTRDTWCRTRSVCWSSYEKLRSTVVVWHIFIDLAIEYIESYSYPNLSYLCLCFHNLHKHHSFSKLRYD